MNKLLHRVCSCCIWCSVLFAIFAHVDLYAQGQISGKIVDSSGQPVVGATIAYDKGTKGTSTGIDGTFRVDAGVGTEIVVTFIGYMTTYTKLAANMTITLKEDETAIDEVVVVGYGSIKSKELAGSVAVVNMDDLEDAAVTTIDQALEGRVTGIEVISSDGTPGSEASIVIRGVGSMDDAGPLYVIDGFPQEESDFASLNPDDIESMSVLKDASSTAIYGSRGANGVIIITTKQGKEGKPTITYNGTLALVRRTKEMDMMNDREFVKLQADFTDRMKFNYHYGNQGAQYNNLTWLQNTYYSEDRYWWDYDDSYTINWFDEMSNDNPVQQTHTVSISGRKNNSGYYVSLNYADQEGLLIKSGFNRYQGRLSIDQFLTDKLKLSFNASFASTNTYSSGAEMNRVYQSRPTSWNDETIYTLRYYVHDIGYYLADGTRIWVYPENAIETTRYNPVVNSENTDVNKRIDKLSVNAYLEYSILKNALKFKVSGGYTNGNTLNTTFRGENTNSGHEDLSGNGANGIYQEAVAYSLLNENTITYVKKIKNSHSINAVLGFSAQETSSSSFGYTAVDVPDADLGIAALENGTISATTSTGTISTLLSYFGRINYSYKSKYVLTGTMRRDGSSRFSDGNKWGTFPSGAIAWRPLEEDFLAPLKTSIKMNDAKIKASLGVSGNNRVGDFASQSTVTTSTTYRYSFGNVLESYGSYVSSFPDADLTWEKIRVLNLGTEMSFFKNRIRFEFEYYIKDTFDTLLSTTLPTNSGFSSVKRNVGQINNTGYEFSISTVNIRKKGFTWSSTFNISFNKNTLVALAGGEEAKLSDVGSLDESHIARVGESVARFYGYINDGLFQQSDFRVVESLETALYSDGGYDPITRYVLNDNISTYNTVITTLPGSFKHRDINGDGTVDSNDRTVIGTPYPDQVGSLMNRFSYKNFSLNVYFTWSYGNEIINGTILQFFYQSDARNYGYNRYKFLSDYWNEDNTGARYCSLTPQTVARVLGTNYLEDGSYLRLKTLSLSYTVPKKVVAKLGLKNIRVSYTGNNLWTLTKYTGQDPAVNVGYTALTPGYDSSAYPKTSTNTFGLTITL